MKFEICLGLYLRSPIIPYQSTGCYYSNYIRRPLNPDVNGRPEIIAHKCLSATQIMYAPLQGPPPLQQTTSELW